MSEMDSFYTLSMTERAGLLAVSFGIAIGMGWLVHRAVRGQSWMVRCVIGLLLFWLFVWLSPQGYYAYYLLIFDGLPKQWVIGWPPPVIDVLGFLTFSGSGTLSAHSLGGLGWALIILAFWPQCSNCRDAAN